MKIRCGKQMVLCICHFACQFAVKIARIMTLLKVQVSSKFEPQISHYALAQMDFDSQQRPITKNETGYKINF